MPAVPSQDRILVVDDERNIVELVATALRYEGFEVATARRRSRRYGTSHPVWSCST